jgi:hypothetical protein
MHFGFVETGLAMPDEPRPAVRKPVRIRRSGG